LHCVSLYPTPSNKANLQRMIQMKRSFAMPIGYSDHTEGIHIALAAVALGAEVIEKHITLDKTMPGPDHKASITPDELKALIRETREIERALESV
jgi:N,N'-diacetyllegionaminate synthase